MTLHRRAIAVAAVFLLAAGALSSADAARRLRKQDEAASAPTPGDKRDRLVAAPGLLFNGRAYWQAAAQCGGIYYKLNTLYSDAAVTAKVVRPDPAAYTKLSKEADGALAVATSFYDASEHFLTADRKVSRDDAAITTDVAAHTGGDRLKSIEAALQAAKPCIELYKICRGAFPQMCSDSAALTN